MPMNVHPSRMPVDGPPAHREITAEQRDRALDALGLGGRADIARIEITREHIDVEYLCQDTHCSATIAALPHSWNTPDKWVTHIERITVTRDQR